jgi:Protein of unknown function (DUF2950)
VAASTAAVVVAAAAGDTGDRSTVTEELTMARMRSHGRFAALAILTASLTWSPAIASAQDPGRQTFSSAQAASQALIAAVQRDDRPALSGLLGGGARLIATGDDSLDRADRQLFVEKYRQLHRMTMEPDGTTVLFVGAENWPFPVPLVHKSGYWFFDADAGQREVMMRRIGENELEALQVFQALVDAQRRYAATAHDGDASGRYAPKLISGGGKHDGLYWQGAGNDLSPIGPLLANADGAAHSPTPFHGYYYRVLVGQGAHAPGGAKSYDVNGRMTGGFAFVAYPAEYRSSGVMTFIVGQDGIVHQRDLGLQTRKLAAEMRTYDPHKAWQKVE